MFDRKTHNEYITNLKLNKQLTLYSATTGCFMMRYLPINKKEFLNKQIIDSKLFYLLKIINKTMDSKKYKQELKNNSLYKNYGKISINLYFVYINGFINITNIYEDFRDLHLLDISHRIFKENKEYKKVKKYILKGKNKYCLFLSVDLVDETRRENVINYLLEDNGL